VDRYSTRALLAAAVAALAVFVGACGSTTEPATTGGTTQQEQAPGEFDELTAEQVVAEIARQVPEATPSVVFTAATDPNDLLGRPNGYVSKASFTDTRIDQATLEGLEPGAVDFGYRRAQALAGRGIDPVGPRLQRVHRPCAGPIGAKLRRFLDRHGM